MKQARHFNTTFAELVDNLTINQIKEVLLPRDQVGSYASELKHLEHDIDLIINEKQIRLSAKIIKMMILLAQLNLHVWYIKDKLIENPDNYMDLLRFAQDLNSLRNYIKNLILGESKELTPSTRRSTFFKNENKAWYTHIIKSINDYINCENRKFNSKTQ